MSIDKVVGQSPGTVVARPAERTASELARTAVRTEPAGKRAGDELAAPKIEHIAQRLESYIRSVSRSLEFKVDADSGRTIISVLDAETGDLIRQIPNEEVLRFAELAEEQTIVLFNETV